MERGRQGFLAGITREDILSGRNLGQLFSQQARGQALSESGRLQSAQDSLFGARAGVTREDLLGQRGFGQSQQGSFLDTLFQRSAEDRQARQRLQEIQLAQGLAQQQASRQKKGSLFSLGGGALGAGLGTLAAFALPGAATLPMILAGLGIGGGIGSSLGSGVSGFFGGSGSTGAGSGFFNALDLASQGGFLKRPKATTPQVGSQFTNTVGSLFP